MTRRTSMARFVIALGASALLVPAGCQSNRPQQPQPADAQTAEPDAASSVVAPPAAPPAADDSASHPPPAAPLAIVPFRIAVASGRDTFDVELEVDGQVRVGGKVVGKVDGAGIVTKAGKRVVDLSADGTISITDEEVMHLDANNEVVTSNGTRVSITDDGTVRFVRPDKKPVPGGPIKVEGFTPDMRRTAIVILMGIARVQ